jgi:hypothetical protein
MDNNYFKELFFLIRDEVESLQPTEVGIFTTTSSLLFHKGKNVLGNNQTFVKLFF